MKLKAKKIFITGGAGFIGSHLVDELIKQPCQITVFDNLISGKKEHLEPHFNKKNFSFIKADLKNFPLLKKAIKKQDLVFHFAANTNNREELRLPSDFQLKENLQTTYNVLEAMRLNNIKQLVFPSSATVYGENQGVCLAETHGPLLPTSFYGMSKLSAEGLISAFHYTFGIRALIVRFANIVGDRMDHGVIFDFIQKIKRNPRVLEVLGDGRQRKPFVYIKDCVRSILFIIKKIPLNLDIFNIGAASSTPIKTIAQIVIQEMHLKKTKIRYTGGVKGWISDVPQLKFNINKLKKIGWQSQYTSQQAARQAIKDLINQYNGQ